MKVSTDSKTTVFFFGDQTTNILGYAFPVQVSSCISVQVFSTLTVIEKQPQYLNEQNEESRYTSG